MSIKQQNDEFDSPWKAMLDKYFQEFMELLFPDAAFEIDWSKGYENLDKEFQKIVRDAAIGKRLADKLVKVKRIDGGDLVVLIHTEIQGQYDKTFTKRMFTYHYRILDRYDRQVVSLAVLGDDTDSWTPEGYQYALWGCSLEFRFPLVKLLDYRERWAELENSRNPFATVVMTHLKNLETKNDDDSRKRWKMQITRGMYNKGFTKQDILNIFNFIDWVMTLPPELEEQFSVELETYEKEQKMPYVTSIERRGIEKGRQEGQQEGRQQEANKTLLKILAKRFGSVPTEIDAKIRAASVEQLEAWIDLSLDAETIQQVFNI